MCCVIFLVIPACKLFLFCWSLPRLDVKKEYFLFARMYSVQCAVFRLFRLGWTILARCLPQREEVFGYR